MEERTLEESRTLLLDYETPDDTLSMQVDLWDDVVGCLLEDLIEGDSLGKSVKSK